MSDQLPYQKPAELHFKDGNSIQVEHVERKTGWILAFDERGGPPVYYPRERISHVKRLPVPTGTDKPPSVSTEDVSQIPQTDPQPERNETPLSKLQTHMAGHGVATDLVEWRDHDSEGENVWFKEDFDQMTEDELETFRDYTMSHGAGSNDPCECGVSFVEVSEWVERNDNTFPDGFEVSYEDINEVLG